MEDALISAEEVTDIEARFNVKLPSTYVGIPKRIFAYLACRHLGNVRDPDKETLQRSESVLLTLSEEESEVIAQGGRLPASRRESIARELSLSMYDVNNAIGRYSFFLNERVTITVVGEEDG